MKSNKAATKPFDASTSTKQTRRLNINLPGNLYDELQQLASAHGKTLTEVVRTGLGLAHIALSETGPEKKLTISDKNGKAIKEIVILK